MLPADYVRGVPDVPWTSRAAMEPGDQYLVLVSHLALKRISSTVQFFRGVTAVRKQLEQADGLIAYTLRAKPLARDYWTLSVWKDQSALQEFVRTPPHVRLMGSLKPVMGATKFVQWEITGAEGRPDWSAAIARLSPA